MLTTILGTTIRGVAGILTLLLGAYLTLMLHNWLFGASAILCGGIVLYEVLRPLIDKHRTALL